MRDLLRQPSIVVFLLGLLGAILAWGVRQELLQHEQQLRLTDLARRVGILEEAARH